MLVITSGNRDLVIKHNEDGTFATRIGADNDPTTILEIVLDQDKATRIASFIAQYAGNAIVPTSTLKSLEGASLALDYLNAAGLDNWPGCDEAYAMAREDGYDIDF